MVSIMMSSLETTPSALWNLSRGSFSKRKVARTKKHGLGCVGGKSKTQRVWLILRPLFHASLDRGARSAFFSLFLGIEVVLITASGQLTLTRFLSWKESNALKLLALTICLSLLSLSCARHQQSTIPANEANASTRLFRIFKDRKFGFIDRSGKVVIEPQFDWVEDFSEGVALVPANGTRVFIDNTGKVAIEPKAFEVINGFTDGLARGNVTDGSAGKGYIDKSGKLAIDIPALYGECEFSEGLACVQTSKWGYIDTSGRFVIKPQFDEVNYFHEGLATVTVRDKSKADHHRVGYVNKAGKIVVKPQFDIAQSFSEGFAAVGMRDGDTYQFGFIDKTGAMLIKPLFQWAVGFHEGFAAVQVSKKWGYIDKNGNMIIKPEYDKAEGFSEGLAAVAINGKWGYIDKSGNFVIEPRFNEAQAFLEGLAFVKVGGDDANAIHDVSGFDAEGKWGYIDKVGTYIWQPTN
jgi:hypothetical protein